MVDQLLWIEALLKFSFGVVLVAFPGLFARFFGLSAGNETFFTRLLGLALIGLSLALAIEGAGRQSAGLGLQGVAALNLTVAAGMALGLTFTRRLTSPRARRALWLCVAALTGLAAFEFIVG